MRCVQIEDDEMEMSEDDRDYRNSSSKRSRLDNEHLKDENDSLRCQLEVCKNEMTLVRSDQKSDIDVREKQFKVLQETIRNLQTQLLENRTKEKEFTLKINDLELKLKQANVKELLLKTKIANNRQSTSTTTSSSSSSTTSSKSLSELSQEEFEKSQLLTLTLTGSGNSCSSINNSDIQHINQIDEINDTNDASNQTNNTQIQNDNIDLVGDARIIALVSTFLVVHPFGASPDYICSYLQKTHPNLRLRDLEEILSKYNSIFIEEITGIGMKIERKWKFCGYEQTKKHKSQLLVHKTHEDKI